MRKKRDHTLVKLERVIPAIRRIKRRLAVRSRAQQMLRSLRGSGFGIRLIEDLLIDLRYGGWCGGVIASNDSAISRVQSSHYCTLRKMFSQLDPPVSSADVLVDVGCGKGRVLNYWLHANYQNTMIGVDLKCDVVQVVARRLRHYPNVRVVCADILDCMPPDGTIYYLYNPFGATIMRTFAEQLLTTASFPRQVRLLYLNARHVEIFANDERWELTPIHTGTWDDAFIIRPRSNPLVAGSAQ